MRKAWTIICCALCLVFLSFPLSGLAASKEIYYTVKGNQKVVPGIYKAVPNGKAVPVLKEKNYKMKEVSKPPVRLEDANLFYVNERAAQAADYEDYFELNNQPIQDVQVVGKDLYFTKLLVRSVYAGSCGGGGADILEIYKRSSNGKITKVTSDRVSSDAKNRFKVIGSYIYYAKVENEAMGNFTIIKSSLDGKKKQILYKGVEDFWIHQNQIYFVKDGKLYSMGMDGKGVKSITSIKTKIYGDSGCGGGNYFVSDNGFSVTDYSGEKSAEYYLDFTSKKVMKLPVPDMDSPILDVDFKKNRFVSELFDGDQLIVGVYDFKGKLLRKLKAYDPWSSGTYIYSVDAKSGQLLYVEGTSLKEIKF